MKDNFKIGMNEISFEGPKWIRINAVMIPQELGNEPWVSQKA
jgi:hypothetical protein